MLDDSSTGGSIGNGNGGAPAVKRGAFILPGDDPAAELHVATAKTVDHLGKSGLMIEDFPPGDIEPISALQAKARRHAEVSGYLIKFRGPDGELTGFERQRNLSGKGGKELQKAGTGAHVFFPVIESIDWLNLPPGSVIHIFESVIKTKRATKEKGVIGLGINGVSASRSKKTKQFDILDDFKLIDWKGLGLTARILFDSNVRDNPMVKIASSTLAYELSSLGAKVDVIKLPHRPDGTQWGIDDYLQAGGKWEDLVAEEIPHIEELGAINKEYAYMGHPAGVLNLKSGRLHNRKEWCDGKVANRHMWIESLDHRFDPPKAKPVKVSIGKQWISWPNRREYEEWEFAPGEPEDLANGNRNLWKGWGCDSIKGDVSLFYELLDHVFDGDKVLIQRFACWLAYPIKFPGYKTHLAWVIFGPPWCGKSLIADIMRGIYGDAWELVNSTILHNPHNEWQNGTQFAFFDEAFSVADDKRAEYAAMKLRITQPTVEINTKFVPQYTLPDHINYYIASNESAPVYMTPDDRRYECHEVTRGELDHARANEIGAWGRSDMGAPALRYHFENEVVFRVGDSEYDPRGHSHDSPARRKVLRAGGSNLDNLIEEIIDDQRSARDANSGKATGPWNLIRFDLLEERLKDKGNHNAKAIAKALERAGAKFLARIDSQADGEQGKWTVWSIDRHEFWVKQEAGVIRVAVAGKPRKYERDGDSAELRALQQKLLETQIELQATKEAMVDAIRGGSGRGQGPDDLPN